MKTNIDQNLILAQMQRLNQLAKSGAINPSAESPTLNTEQVKPTSSDFGSLLTKAVNTVNQYQQEASQAATSVETGDGGASLVKAIIAAQKSSIAVQATVQVRNRVVSAYQDIMNMPI